MRNETHLKSGICQSITPALLCTVTIRYTTVRADCIQIGDLPEGSAMHVSVSVLQIWDIR